MVRHVFGRVDAVVACREGLPVVTPGEANQYHCEEEKPSLSASSVETSECSSLDEENQQVDSNILLTPVPDRCYDEKPVPPTGRPWKKNGIKKGGKSHPNGNHYYHNKKTRPNRHDAQKATRGSEQEGDGLPVPSRHSKQGRSGRFVKKGGDGSTNSSNSSSNSTSGGGVNRKWFKKSVKGQHQQRAPLSSN